MSKRESTLNVVVRAKASACNWYLSNSADSICACAVFDSCSYGSRADKCILYAAVAQCLSIGTIDNAKAVALLRSHKLIVSDHIGDCRVGGISSISGIY